MPSLIFRQLALGTLFSLSLASTAENTTPPPQQEAPIKIEALPLEELRIFTQVYSGVRASYIEELDDKTLLEYAIKGILSELDPHSAYLDASSFDDLQVQTTGEFGGLGIEVGMEDGYIKVISPIDDTPAERAGVEAGDLIIKLDGNSVKGKSLDEAIESMRGPKGTDIVITIVREGEAQPFDLTLTRDVIKVRSVRSGVRDEYYGYIRVAQFQLHSGDDVAAALKELQEASSELKGLVLDLRNNPGGVLSAAVDMVDVFLDGGLVVYTEGRVEGSKKQYYAEAGDQSQGLPIIVLINDGSASASEIVAGALQDHGRALVLGTRSFGKGSVQSVIPISEDRAIKLTTSRYYTPNGRSIQAQGIEPDISVERVRVTAVQPRARYTEADLSGHLSNSNGGEESRAKDRNSSDTDLQNQDSQLYEALNLLKGLALFNKKDKTLPTDVEQGDDKQAAL
ncbi:S41 family peptidase [Agaribacterium haliotis]|uniref:S41 family peptidase n=1 Tax=Agaribacterium haliotis TaxID=2013869 RepID=UPI001EFEED94|nr:S41 family peptidase [Agaribacterium haliotis]